MKYCYQCWTREQRVEAAGKDEDGQDACAGHMATSQPESSSNQIQPRKEKSTMNQKSEIDREKLLVMREAGKGVPEIARTFGVSPATIYKYLKESGAPKKKRTKADERLKRARVEIEADSPDEPVVTIELQLRRSQIERLLASLL